MFTIEQIKAAHSKVQSGADFPAYIADLKNLGVQQYETFVADGHTDYYGADDYTVTTAAHYEPLLVSDTAQREAFIAALKAHQAGKTDYPTFCHSAASTGVEKWVVRLTEMTCTYYDKAGHGILVETIPNYLG